MMSKRGRAVWWLGRRRAALAVILPLSLATVAVSVAADPSPGTCNRNVAGVPSTEFQLPNVGALRTRIPRFGLAPELDAVGGPFTVVVFEGSHQAVPIFPPLQTGPAAPILPNNVLCVVEPSGVENYYSGVDFDGLNLEGLSLDRLSN